jgi:hypothetical protein
MVSVQRSPILKVMFLPSPIAFLAQRQRRLDRLCELYWNRHKEQIKTKEPNYLYFIIVRQES